MKTYFACGLTCWACKFGEHDGHWHTWADEGDKAFAEAHGYRNPSTEQCGCSCQAEVPAPPLPTAERAEERA